MSEQMITLGTTVPDAISREVERMTDVLQDCTPFNDQDAMENQDLLDVTMEAATELVRFVSAIRELHEEGRERRIMKVVDEHNRKVAMEGEKRS
jgi:hypothetical protein